MSSVLAVYVDETFVAHAVAKEFGEAARGQYGARRVEFFGAEGSFNCLVRAVTRRISNEPMIQLRKRPDIRRKVREFLQSLRENRVLERPDKGPNHGKWIFSPSRMKAVKVVNDDEISELVSSVVPMPGSGCQEVDKPVERDEADRESGQDRDRPPYLNASQQLHPPVACQPSPSLA